MKETEWSVSKIQFWSKQDEDCGSLSAVCAMRAKLRSSMLQNL